MKIFIPEIGTELILTKEWSFKLILEHRNNKLISRFYPEYYNYYSYYNYKIGCNILQTKKLHNLLCDFYDLNNHLPNEQYQIGKKNIFDENRDQYIKEDDLEPVVLPIGTILKVDRIYIRKGKGMSDYSSLSFYATYPGEKKKIRFFAKLNDVNTIEFE